MHISFDKVSDIMTLHDKLVLASQDMDRGKNVYTVNDMMESFRERKENKTPEAKAYNSADTALEAYMMSLTYEEILDLEAMIDYGRDLYAAGAHRGIDQEFIEYLKDSEDTATLLFPAEILCQIRQQLQDMYPSEEGKSDAVDYMISKNLLSDYLRCALEALKKF